MHSKCVLIFDPRLLKKYTNWFFLGIQNSINDFCWCGLLVNMETCCSYLGYLNTKSVDSMNQIMKDHQHNLEVTSNLEFIFVYKSLSINFITHLQYENPYEFRKWITSMKWNVNYKLNKKQNVSRKIKHNSSSEKAFQM